MKRLLSVVLLLVVVFSLGACAKKETVPILKEEDIRAVCELATLECFYNNVAKIEKKASNIFQKNRKMWIEHEGVATIGIDMRELVINISDQTITMIMPKAKILSIKPNEKSLDESSYVVSADGWLIKNKITAEEQQEAIMEGQTKMEAAILSNSGLFERAETRAKKLIENLINKVSEQIGQEYKIIWKEREE